MNDYNRYISDASLYSVLLNATNRCNLACRYCFTHPNQKDMSVECAKDAIIYGLNRCQNDKLSVIWFGGEPTLMLDRLIFPIMEWAEKENLPVKWSMTSNLTLLTKEKLDRLEHFQCGILFSIDGPKEIQDFNRQDSKGIGSWDLIERNLLYLKKYPFCQGIRSTVIPETAGKIFESYKWARENGFNMWFPGPDIGNSGWNIETFEHLKRELFYIAMAVYDQIISGIGFTDVPPITEGLKYFMLMKDIDISEDEISINPQSLLKCGLGTTSLGVDPDGNLYACQEHSTYGKDDFFNIGNLATGVDKNKHLAFLNKYIDDVERARKEIRKDKDCSNCICYPKCFYLNRAECASSIYELKKDFGEKNQFWCWYKKLCIELGELILIRASSEGQDITNFIKFILTTPERR